MIRRALSLGFLLCAISLSCSPSAELRAGAAESRRPEETYQPPRAVLPVLDFPEPGLDDTAAYRGYKTRFYRDSKHNTVQIYLEPLGGRVVTLLANAGNESVGFTVRNSDGQPARLNWAATEAEVTDSGTTRTIAYELTADAPRIGVGLFLLGSMRVERDFQYGKQHLRPFTARPFLVAEESLLVGDVERLPVKEQRRHLALLAASTVPELRSRLHSPLVSFGRDSLWVVRLERPSLDGRNRLVLELSGDASESTARASARSFSIWPGTNSRVRLTVRITTDAAPLSPLTRNEIFNRRFLGFLSAAGSATDSAAVGHYRRMERQVRGVELLSSKEKLMAGLPNFATYFGRDMMMTALMMRPIWTAGMSEHVIASVLRKLGPKGDVSHEEALGGQAIRENAVVYDSLITGYFRAARAGRRPQADSLLEQARTVLGELQKTRENCHMIDDEFQLPVLSSRYLGDPSVSPEQKRAFLLNSSEGKGPRLALLLREMALVAKWTAPYVQDPRPVNLVSFPRRDATHWRSASWRDSDAGYAGGRFAMDINVIWVPGALQSIDTILGVLPSLGITLPMLDSLIADPNGALAGYARDRSSLSRAIGTWNGARRHFRVSLAPADIRRRTAAKLAWLPASERRYWKNAMAEHSEVGDSLTFLALSLDSNGRPIPVISTDPATELFLNPDLRPKEALAEVIPFLRPYPVGLFVEGLGPLVANDAYASRHIWERFQADQYHGPRVVWGREVNLLFLGLANQISAAAEVSRRIDVPIRVVGIEGLEDALHRTLTAVNASGLQHNELWSYEIRGEKLVPVRYGTSSDVQLWNTTDLAVEFVLSTLPRP